MVTTATRTLAREKLATSGLTLADAEALGIEIAQSASKILPAAPDVPALVLRYFSPTGSLRKDTLRLRLLKAPPAGVFGESAAKPIRYLQPAKTPPAAYLPRTLTWTKILADATKELVITEGELKSACACRNGFAALGLGGVSSWRSAKRGWAILPELADAAWSARRVVICFDSDAATNPQVAAATSALVTELGRRGAFPVIAKLPAVEGLPKTGIDDFLVARGRDALVEVFQRAECDDLIAKLWDFNSRFAVILDPGLVYDERRETRVAPEPFRSTLYANEWATKIVDGGGSPRLKQVQVAHEWLAWSERRQYDAFTYAPSQPAVVGSKLNGWRGWGTTARAGSVRPWTALLDHLFTDEPLARAWFERWCGYPIRYSGTKLMSACGIWSSGQGQGKSLIGVTLGTVYGSRNYISISQRELESGFNEWSVDRQFVMIDDVSSYDSRAKADVLKKLITQREQVVNMKYISAFVVPDCVNYYLTSNRPNAFYIDAKDRRFFVHEVTVDRLSTKFYDEYHAWLEGDGPGALLYYFQHELDFKGFDPHEAPPTTIAKRDMVESAQTEVGLWLSELREDPDPKLYLGQVALTRDVYTPSELLALFNQTRQGPPLAVNTLGVYLQTALPRITRSGVLRINGRIGRYYIARNAAKWSKTATAEIAKHIEDHPFGQGIGGKF